MDVYNKPIYPRLAALFVLLLLHGGLILVFLRERPAYREQSGAPEVPTIIFFIDSQAGLPLPPPESSRISRRPTGKRQNRSGTEAAISSLDTTAPAENQGPAAPPPVDWLAEARRSAAEIASRGESDRAAESPAAPAPWDLRPLFESTGHGLKLRIPVEIPGKLIDHCFGNMDLGHDLTGQWERYQLGCAFRKQPARGDLFDSLRKPSEPPQ